MSYKIFFAFCVMLLGTFSRVDAEVVEFRLETTDTSGSVIDTINVGEQFVLSVLTKTSEEDGVFAGYLDVTYDDSLASVVGSVDHDDEYPNGKNAELDQAGLLNNVGSFTINAPLGNSERHLWSLLMQADNEGVLNLVGSESLDYPEYEVLVFGLDVPIEPTDITFGSASLTIVPEPSGLPLLLLGCVCCFRYLAPSRLN